MYALSIHQPWAWAILHAGKTIENRSWRTKYRGPLIVHASQSRTSHQRQDPQRWRRVYGVALPAWESLTRGAIVGVVDLVDCVPFTSALGVWADPGAWCWVLENPRPLAHPLPYRGAQMLFPIPDELILPALSAAPARTESLEATSSSLPGTSF